MELAYLADGTPVRVMSTPFPIGTPQYRVREGDRFMHAEWGSKFIPFEPGNDVIREFTARMGADGQLWLVQTDGPPWPTTSPT